MSVIEDGTVGYIKIPSFDGLRMEEEVPKIKAFMKAHRQLAHFIVDIRGNGGGSDSYWSEAFVSSTIQEVKSYTSFYLYNEETLSNRLSRPFIEEIHSYLFEEKAKLEDVIHFEHLSPYANQFAYCTYQTKQIMPQYDPESYKGKLWVLTDAYNASASAGFIDFCKQNQFATLVGEADSGDNCNGDPFLFSLPNCGMIIRFDLFYGLNADGTCNGVSGCKPDIECSSKEALKVCLEQIQIQAHS